VIQRMPRPIQSNTSTTSFPESKGTHPHGVIGTNRLARISAKLEPLRVQLLNHPLYPTMGDIGAVRRFMEHHVYAVWDFMSLLKALQRSICCVNVPWTPPADRAAARLVNEIVLAEESDEDGEGGFASHYDLYWQAMRQTGADTTAIDVFIQAIREGASLEGALAVADPPAGVVPFVRHTFGLIESGNLPAIASAFTFGRENLLPGLFQKIVDEVNAKSRGALSEFVYYLDRHISLDGDDHGPKARLLVAALCGDDDAKWQAAEQAAVESLEVRLALWNAMMA
jgi:hypothetical protein